MVFFRDGSQECATSCRFWLPTPPGTAVNKHSPTMGHDMQNRRADAVAPPEAAAGRRPGMVRVAAGEDGGEEDTDFRGETTKLVTLFWLLVFCAVC